MTLEELLAACEKIAEEVKDGHLTIYRFTTGWKVVLGTPEMSMAERCALWYEVPGRISLPEALAEFLGEPLDPAGEKGIAAKKRFWREIDAGPQG